MRRFMQGLLVGVSLLYPLGAADAGSDIPAQTDTTTATDDRTNTQPRPRHQSAVGNVRWLTSSIHDLPDDPPREQRVTFTLLFPQRYLMVITKPDDAGWKTILRCDGVTLQTIEYTDPTEQPLQKQQPVSEQDALLPHIIALIHGDNDLFARDCTVTEKRTEDTRTRTLVPRTESPLAHDLARLTVTYRADQLHHVDMRDVRGTRQQFTDLQVTFDTVVDPNLFVVPPRR